MKKIMLLCAYVILPSAAFGMNQPNIQNNHLQQKCTTIANAALCDAQDGDAHDRIGFLGEQEKDITKHILHSQCDSCATTAPRDAQDGDAHYRIDLPREQKKDIKKKTSHSQCDSFFY